MFRWWRRRDGLAHMCSDLSRLLAVARQERDDARREADALQELGARAARERDAALAEVHRLRAQLVLSRWPRVN